MANRKTLTKAVRDLTVTGLTASGLTRIGYLDISEQLSRVNRKLFSQEMTYGVSDVTVTFPANPAYDNIRVVLSTAGDTWPVHNGWVKGKALWDEMNQLVLEDNPSIQGTWSDYKVYLDSTHRTLNVAGNNLDAIDSESVAYIAGEWNYSDYVLPQHSVDAAGNPLAADQCQAHLIGPTTGAPGNFISVGLVDSYQESRATVQLQSPNVPAGMSQSFFNLLTDSGSQEPELADIIEAENDRPPYDLLNYPGGSVNGAHPVITSISAASVYNPIISLPGFISQCGLVKVSVQAYLNGVAVLTPDMSMLFTIAPGMYKGVAAIPMGQ